MEHRRSPASIPKRRPIRARLPGDSRRLARPAWRPSRRQGLGRRRRPRPPRAGRGAGRCRLRRPQDAGGAWRLAVDGDADGRPTARTALRVAIVAAGDAAAAAIARGSARTSQRSCRRSRWCSAPVAGHLPAGARPPSSPRRSALAPCSPVPNPIMPRTGPMTVRHIAARFGLPRVDFAGRSPRRRSCRARRRPSLRPDRSLAPGGLAAAAAEAGAAEIRPAPGRALLALPLGTSRAPSCRRWRPASASSAMPPIRGSIAACPGARLAPPATPPPALAEQLSPLAGAMLDGSFSVHVSGCAKGCAHPAAGGLTFVGRRDGIGLLVGGKAPSMSRCDFPWRDRAWFRPPCRPIPRGAAAWRGCGRLPRPARRGPHRRRFRTGMTMRLRLYPRRHGDLRALVRHHPRRGRPVALFRRPRPTSPSA